MTTCGRLHVEKFIVCQLVRNSLHFVDHKGNYHVHKSSLLVPIHSFIYSAFQRSTKVDIELVIIIIIGTVQNDS